MWQFKWNEIFLERHELLEVIQEETENLHNPVSITEIKSIIKSIPLKNFKPKCLHW